jgi:hypothetical protein
MVALTALVSHGNPRFRTVVEPVFAIGLAHVALEVRRRLTARGSAKVASLPVEAAA